MLVPKVIGILMLVGILSSVLFFLNSSYGKEAEKVALSKMPLNSDFKASVRSLEVSYAGGETRISAVVVVWNNETVDDISVHWTDQGR